MTAPNGCAHCGVEARDHMNRWKLPVGWHRWAAPSQEQIKARMVARRSPASPVSGVPGTRLASTETLA